MNTRGTLFIGSVALAFAGVGCADLETASSDDNLESSWMEFGPNPLGVKTETICFSVHRPGDPVAIPITGTRFSKRSFEAVKPTDRVILLLHGGVETRDIFDGGKAGIDDNSSFARRLARRGYLVVTVDRAGYGDSPYVRGPGAGFSLTPDSYVEMTHEIVTQLHHGTYTREVGASCGSGPAVGLASWSVILGGHSIGGGETMLYATRYHDIDGLVVFAWNNTGTASIPTALFVSWIVPQFRQGKDYVTFFPPGASGVSADCVLGFFSQPLAQTAVDPEVVAIECANENLETSPSGELANTAVLRQAVLANLPNVGPTPALLTFADVDTMVAGANNPAGDPDFSGQEVALWQQTCNCDVTTYTQPAAGHAMFYPDTMPDLVAAVVDWLHSRGLHPRS
jgi:pimeloyl-ACP methyl ester carboxylesterase